MGHKHPPVIDQLQDATSSSSLSNTLSSLSSYTLSLSSSNNSSRSLTSARSKTNLDNNSLFLSSSQSTKKWQEQHKWNLTCQLCFILLRLGYEYNVRRCLQYPTSITVCRKNVGWKFVKNVTLCTQRMRGESAQVLSNRLATSTWLRVESWWSNFLPTAQWVLPELCSFFWVLQGAIPELSSIKGEAISCGRRVDVCLGLLVWQKVI